MKRTITGECANSTKQNWSRGLNWPPGRTLGSPALREHPATLQKTLLLSTISWPEARRGTEIDLAPFLSQQRRTRDTALIHLSVSRPNLLFLANKTPRYLNSSYWKTPGEGKPLFPVENHAFALGGAENWKEPVTKGSPGGHQHALGTSLTCIQKQTTAAVI